jgi:hypothetical protein
VFHEDTQERQVDYEERKEVVNFAGNVRGLGRGMGLRLEPEENLFPTRRIGER